MNCLSVEARECVEEGPKNFGRAWLRVGPQMGKIEVDLELSLSNLLIGTVT
jgi:hypothetical protein